MNTNQATQYRIMHEVVTREQVKDSRDWILREARRVLATDDYGITVYSIDDIEALADHIVYGLVEFCGSPMYQDVALIEWKGDTQINPIYLDALYVNVKRCLTIAIQEGQIK